MTQHSKAWPGMPAFDMDLRAARLLSGHEIRARVDAYGAAHGLLTLGIGLEGKPIIIRTLVSIPLDLTQRMEDGHPIVMGMDSLNNDPGLTDAPPMPGLPTGTPHAYDIKLDDGGTVQVRAHCFRIEEDVVYFSLTCKTESGSELYDIVSIPLDAIYISRNSEPAIERIA